MTYTITTFLRKATHRTAIIVTSLLVCAGTAMARKAIPVHPDMQKIKTESTNPASKFYYPKLLRQFLSNDTVMTDEDYRYFYYGTLFQEDYDPYRPYPFKKELEQTRPLYFKQENLTRAERTQIENLAKRSLENNPLDLSQLMYRVYVYEKNRKYNLAKIWKHKLDHLLLTIAGSGSGDSKENAWVVVYPSHEFEFFNIAGGSVLSQDFEPPYYEKLKVRHKNSDTTTEHYFNLHHMLEQYYAKHPEEAQPAGTPSDDTTNDVPAQE